MKESKVHLVSAALEKNNNQDHFYNNPHLEFLEKQTSVNNHLMNCVSQLDQSCNTILKDIRDQNIILNKLNNNHRYDYGNIKKILLNFAQTSKESKSQLQKVGQTLQVIHVHLDNQSEFNDVTNKRTKNLERALTKLQGSVNRQRNFLNNFAIKQNSSFDNINAQLGQHGKQFDTQREIIQNVIEEQKRFFTIVSKNLKEQNLLHKIYSGKQDDLIHNNTILSNDILSKIDHQAEIFNLLNEQFNRQKEILIELSETQNNQFDLIVNQFKEQNDFNNCLSEKQELSEEMDELIFEEIKLQITQQDDIYNYLQDSLNRQQGFLLQLSDNQNRQLKKVTDSLGNIKETEVRHNDTLTEVKASIEKILYAKGNIGRHLSKLPPDSPIKQVILSGVAIPVEKLVLVNQNTGIAFFASGTQTISIDIEKIEGIHWE
ncbi:hypothetical protein MPH47_06985 [Psychrobacillus psychrodurans]|uniref:hypothetical protein n=1 Tax=Psychrobacillus TaxID=1221880 RepID=UPI001F4D4226|nr:hypothetical protein [Psychrobacillus psychrodurans]MCK1996974.1 hypothetical protein [Psychrobacillus psychrodurans]